MAALAVLTTELVLPCSLSLGRRLNSGFDLVLPSRVNEVEQLRQRVTKQQPAPCNEADLVGGWSVQRRRVICPTRLCDVLCVF